MVDRPYRAVVHDGPVARTMEQQTFLLAGASARVSDLWYQRSYPVTEADDLKMVDAMRSLDRALHDTDIFMAGVAAGRKES
jgi:hypothetical protein